jgi:CubicO group peptidase (beta-lactamase class C family)
MKKTWNPIPVILASCICIMSGPLVTVVAPFSMQPLLAAQSPSTPTASPSLQAVSKRVQASAAEQFAKCPSGALSIAIVERGKSDVHHFGHVDGKAGPAPTGSTVYRIGSITKMFTALAFLKLEGDDRCNLSDPVERFVPEFAKIPRPPPSGAKVTLIQLATHTGGLARDPEDAEPLQSGPVSDWNQTLLRAVPNTRYVADPGSVYSYSNVGYAFLGAAVEKVAGVPYTRYLSENVLLPLAMRDTVFELSQDQRVRLAPGWTVSKTGASTAESEAELAGRGYRVPAGGLFSTLDDMTRWLRFEMGELKSPVFDSESLADAQRRIVHSGPQLERGYGIGMEFRRFGEAVVFGHSGGVPGYQAELFFDPAKQTGIVVLRSAVFGDFDSNAILAAAFASTSK